MAEQSGLAKTLVELADTLVADFDVVDFLHTLALRSTELLHAAEAGLMLADHPLLPIYFYVNKHLVKPQVVGWYDNVMNVVYSASTFSLQTDRSAVRDFAVGHVLLTNDQQGRSVREQLVQFTLPLNPGAAVA